MARLLPFLSLERVEEQSLKQVQQRRVSLNDKLAPLQ